MKCSSMSYSNFITVNKIILSIWRQAYTKTFDLEQIIFVDFDSTTNRQRWRIHSSLPHRISKRAATASFNRPQRLTLYLPNWQFIHLCSIDLNIYIRNYCPQTAIVN